MKRVMTVDQAEHFYAWLERFHIEDQHEIEQAVHAALEHDPELIGLGRSWAEIERAGRALAAA